MAPAARRRPRRPPRERPAVPAAGLSATADSPAPATTAGEPARKSWTRAIGQRRAGSLAMVASSSGARPRAPGTRRRVLADDAVEPTQDVVAHVVRRPPASMRRTRWHPATRRRWPRRRCGRPRPRERGTPANRSPALQWDRVESAEMRVTPKSMTLTRPCGSTTTFAGFTSRCTMPASWAAASASATWCVSTATSATARAPLRRTSSVSVMPSAGSVTSQSRPVSSSRTRSRTRATWGCRRLDAARASRSAWSR